MAKVPTSNKAPAPARPTRRAAAVEPAKQTKKQIAHGRREARQKRIIWLSVAGLVVVILAILLSAVINQAVLKPAKAVALVNNAKIRQTDHESLVQYQRTSLEGAIQSLQDQLETLDPADTNNQFLISFYQQQVEQYQTQLASVEQTALDELIDDALIEQKAKESGVAVSPGEVQQSIDEDLTRLAAANAQTAITDTQTVTGTQPTPTPTPVPQKELDLIYESALANLQLSDKDFRGIVRRSLLREKVQELLSSEVVTTGQVIHAQVIVTNTNEVATAAETRIKNGEDFGAVARSVDPQAKDNGGDVGWLAQGQASRRYGQALEDWLFSQQPGALAVVESNGQFHVVQVLEKDDNGPLPADELSYRQNNALTDWLAQRKASPDVKVERLLAPADIPTELPVAQPTP
jgi:parvulin-like peptidyl-prolyl isomerase